MEDIQELMVNKFDLVEWVQKKSLKGIRDEIKKDFDKSLIVKKELNEAQQSLSSSIRSINSYTKQLQIYEEELNKKRFELNDRDNNLQRIYDKMIQIEKKLNEGEWPGILPPLNINLGE